MDEVVRRLIPDDPELARVAGYAGGADGHFVLDRGGKVFKQTAPVIKLSESATEDDHLALLGVLNSEFGRELDSLAQHLAATQPFAVCAADVPTRERLDAAHAEHERIRGRMTGVRNGRCGSPRTAAQRR